MPHSTLTSKTTQQKPQFHVRYCRPHGKKTRELTRGRSTLACFIHGSLFS
jgi:hypothetical protein